MFCGTLLADSPAALVSSCFWSRVTPSRCAAKTLSSAATRTSTCDWPITICPTASTSYHPPCLSATSPATLPRQSCSSTSSSTGGVTSSPTKKAASAAGRAPSTWTSSPLTTIELRSEWRWKWTARLHLPRAALTIHSCWRKWLPTLLEKGASRLSSKTGARGGPAPV